MTYGEVALGVECALPARFNAGRARQRRLSPLVRLLLGVVTLAIL